MACESAAADLSGDKPRPAPFFTPPEWLALFPSRVERAPGSVWDAVAGSDPLSAMPDRVPLARSALLAELGGASTAAGFLVGLQFRLQPFAARLWARMLPYLALFVAVFDLAWVFNDGRFGTAQLVAATVAFNMAVVVFGAVLPLSASYRSSFRPRSPASPRIQPADDESGHAFAGIARFRQLDRAEGRESRLLAHDARDPLCPCPLPGCAGRTLSRAGTLRALDCAFRIPLLVLLIVGVEWTSVVTLGDRLWATWYGATLAALFFASAAVLHAPNLLGRTPANVATLGLGLRLHQRAVTIALRSMLLRYSDALFPDPDAGGPGKFPDPGPGAQDEPYLVLHAALASTWRSRLPFLSSGGPLILSVFPVSAIPLVANAIAGGCIPAFTLYTLLYLLYALALDVVNLAAANAQIAAVTEKFLDASDAARTLLARAQQRPAPLADPAAAGALANHAGLLVQCADAERFKGRLFGFAVDAGVVRSAFLTSFTAAVGFVSLLKAAGLSFTLDAVCPSP
ncbi:hypothetical protein DFJ74DRAFT_743438 [Hyaloraphidium curvatum]|nr:hypothetical protein DFJ74DRAFT_743438 [Hyaloraphidium curvatum]